MKFFELFDIECLILQGYASSELGILVARPLREVKVISVLLDSALESVPCVIQCVQ
jgi:hypothetical protein